MSNVRIIRAGGREIGAVIAHINRAVDEVRPLTIPERLQRAKAYLRRTKSLIGASDYIMRPRHSINADIWQPAREPYLDEVARLGRIARERNPAFQRAQEIAGVISK